MGKKEKTIYDLKLHETITIISIHKVFDITRVPGGWIYKTKYEEDSGVFVPYVSNKLNKRIPLGLRK